MDYINRGGLSAVEEQTISLEVEVFQLHHLLWTLRYFIHRKRPAGEYEHVLRECYETICRMVMRCKALSDLRWKARMDEPRERRQTDEEGPIGGGGGDGRQRMIRTPVQGVLSQACLCAFDAELAAIDLEDLASFLDLPRG